MASTKYTLSSGTCIFTFIFRDSPFESVNVASAASLWSSSFHGNEPKIRQTKVPRSKLLVASSASPIHFRILCSLNNVRWFSFHYNGSSRQPRLKLITVDLFWSYSVLLQWAILLNTSMTFPFHPVHHASNENVIAHHRRPYHWSCVSRFPVQQMLRLL